MYRDETSEPPNFVEFCVENWHPRIVERYKPLSSYFMVDKNSEQDLSNISLHGFTYETWVKVHDETNRFNIVPKSILQDYGSKECSGRLCNAL